MYNFFNTLYDAIYETFIVPILCLGLTFAILAVIVTVFN